MSAKAIQNKARSTRKGALAKPTQKNQPRSRSKKNRRGNNRAVMNLSPCAKVYAAARLDPFNYTKNELPCIPDLYDLPSQKVCTLVRGTCSTGTSGVGFLMASGDWNSNDQGVVWYTTSTFSGVTSPTTTDGINRVQVFDAKFPYPSASLRNHRMVASALRFRYVGTELDRGGLLSALVCNAEGASPTTFTQDQLLGNPSSLSFEVNRKWHTIGFNPAYAEAYAFNQNNYTLGGAVPTNAKFLVAYSGAVSKVSLEWELIGYHEIISFGGNQVTAPTKSHSDLPGLSFVRDFFSNEEVQQVGSSAFQQFLGYAKSAGVQAVSSYVGAPSSPMLLEWL